MSEQPTHYRAEEHTVWWFAIQQLRRQLSDLAHPAFPAGLKALGLTTTSVPRIARVSEALAPHGWKAVCVNGFIPPRVFQAFQSLGILPIAGSVRPSSQLAYTPAPDIIHEAAGHAPLLVVPEYAAYLRAIGDVARRAFANPDDDRLDRAVRAVSDLKLSGGDPAELSQAEAELEAALQATRQPSEARRMSRLYWWTAEYGLIGSLDRPRLYGAGLLSSIGESLSCMAPTVAKHPLSEACLHVPVDITHRQPQLFVARDFVHLHEVLATVAQGLAFSRGGAEALRQAVLSREPCTVLFSRGLRISGVLEPDCPISGGWLGFQAGAHIHCEGHPALAWPERLVVPLGRVTTTDSGGARRRMAFGAGATASGELAERGPARREGLTWLTHVQITWGGRTLLESLGPYPLLTGAELCTAEAGAADWGAPEATSPAELTPALTGPQVRRDLYTCLRRTSPSASLPLAALYARLRAEAGTDWLLHWALLDKLRRGGPRRKHLATQEATARSRPSQARGGAKLRHLLMAYVERDLTTLLAQRPPSDLPSALGIGTDGSGRGQPFAPISERKGG